MGYIFSLPNMNKKHVIGIVDWVHGDSLVRNSSLRLRKRIIFLGQGADFWRPTNLWSLKVYFWLI